MRRRRGNDDEQCCFCGQAIEKDDHLFQCSGRKQYKQQIIGALKKAEKVMETTLNRILKAGIVNFLNGNIDSFLHTCIMMMKRTRNRVYPKRARLLDHKLATMDAGSDKNTHLKYQEYHQLLDEQEIIGWDNLLRGRFSMEWRRLQREYEVTQEMKRKSLQRKRRCPDSNFSDKDQDENNDDVPLQDTRPDQTTNEKPKKKKKKRKPDRFQNLIRAFFDIAKESMWKQRNKDRHEPGNKTYLSATIKVDRVVRGLYSMMH